MTYVVLDDFPTWSIYIPAIVLLLAFIVALSLLRRALQRQPNDPADRARISRSKRPLWLFTIASALALWFMASSMFLRFHAVGFDRWHAELFYLWPQPPVVINFGELVGIKLIRGAGRLCGHLEVATRQERHLSVNFRKCAAAEAIIKQIPVRGEG